ncbi:rab-GTPase-TBC domain-containing protein [Chytriomyces cf. hyalinus JEL632]|nr:rab-GTPase-TBC domain-containing protein [Chytriomyces cf. hyalinus JEL632]
MPSNRDAAEEYVDKLLAMDPIQLAIHETRFIVLERFSRVTNYTMSILPNSFRLLSQPPSISADPSEKDTDGIIDYEPARVYLAKWHHNLQIARAKEANELHAEGDDNPLAASVISDSGRLAMLKEDNEKVAAVNKPRLGVWDETVLADTGIGSFVVLSTDTTPPPPRVSRQPPLSLQEWKLYFDEFIPVPHPLPRPLRSTAEPSDLSESVIHVSTEDASDASSPINEYATAGDGKIIVAFTEIQRRIFVGGVDASVRPQVWRFLYGLYPWDSTHAERLRIKAEKSREYWRMKNEWIDVAEEMERRRHAGGNEDGAGGDGSDEAGGNAAEEMYKDASTRVDKDVPRTDRSHTFYNDENLSCVRPSGVGPFSPHQNLLRDILITYACSYPGSDKIGYVQGMSDLLSPILIVCDGDEKKNFLVDGSGMRMQLETMQKLLRTTDPTLHAHLMRLDALNLFCCFRWFLCAFKREFTLQDTCVIWEVVESKWAAGGPDFMYFIALAILDEHRDAILRCLLTFDELLKYVNDLSQTIPVNSILEAAELLYLRFRVRAASVGAIPSLAISEASSNSSVSARKRGNGKDKKEKKAVAEQVNSSSSSSTAAPISLLEVLTRMEANEHKEKPEDDRKQR